MGKKGMNYDFSFAKAWVVGGEGTSVNCFQRWQNLMNNAGSDRGVASAYGASEVFASACSEFVNARYDFHKRIMSVGIPFAGIDVGVFDNKCNELSYNQRGELWIKSKSVMKGYYNKPELTAKTKIDGWIHTGDLAEIDDNGFVYIWGRLTDKVKLDDDREIYLFDIANKIKEKNYIDDAIVLEKPIEQDKVNLVAHIVWSKDVEDINKENYLKELTEFIKQYESGINLCTYAFHDGMLPYSPTTLKKDKNKMAKQNDGYVMVTDKGIEKIFFSDADNGLYKIYMND